MRHDETLKITRPDGADRELRQTVQARTGADALAVSSTRAFSGPELLLASDDLAEPNARFERMLGEGPSVDAAGFGVGKS